MTQILMVDDEHITHRLVYLILQKEDLQIASAYNGLEAMQFLREQAVDLLITDVNMPFMDGFSLVDQLRADERFQSLPIIMISEYPYPHIPEQAKKRGADAFLSQPFSSWQLNNLVNECLNSGRPAFSDLCLPDRRIERATTLSTAR